MSCIEHLKAGLSDNLPVDLKAAIVRTTGCTDIQGMIKRIEGDGRYKLEEHPDILEAAWEEVKSGEEYGYIARPRWDLFEDLKPP